MKKLIFFIALAVASQAEAQQVLSLDSCRAMAVAGNKQLVVKQLKRDAAAYARKAARTNFLPKVDALGGYEYFSREISLLSKTQKTTLSNLGTTAAESLAGSGDALTQMVMGGMISPQTAKEFGAILQAFGPSIAEVGNNLGNQICDAFDTNTHNIWAGAITVRQPLYTGGALTAVQNMTAIAEEMADNEIDAEVLSTANRIEETYWLIVSLRQKRKLAQAYRDLVQQLDDDVHKLIREGVATRAGGLTVDVKVNEADMALTTVDNGLAMARMLLCKQCGLPLDTDFILEDEDTDLLSVTHDYSHIANSTAYFNRPELRLLQNSIDLSHEATRLVQAAYRPTVGLTAGYMVSNPNIFNGFRNRFAGMFNIGLMVRVPIWSWHEGRNKILASRTATAIAELEMEEAREMIDLQLSQCRFRLDEAKKRLSVATKNLRSAEENLRCANVGFREGVMEATEVMTAQTAWQQAEAQRIDAEIDVKLAQVALKRALGAKEF